MAASETAAQPTSKSKRVRTGCLTCRERHLKCDEGTPDCLNCRKSNRECKRGVRLNFIDLTCRQPPHIPSTGEWSVHFQDESRLIASEYKGGLAKYQKANSEDAVDLQQDQLEITASRTQAPQQPFRNAALCHDSITHDAAALDTSQVLYHNDRGAPVHPDLVNDARYSSSLRAETSFMGPPDTSQGTRYNHSLNDIFTHGQADGGNRRISLRGRQSGSVSTGDSVAEMTPQLSPAEFRRSSDAKGLVTPTSDQSTELEHSPTSEELQLMQIFISEVGIWMDSLDPDKHFSRLIPYHALKCPMLLNALLACGVKHLTLTHAYSDDKALFYYDTATTQLLRSLQNPERNTAECAATAVVLNVYEIMSEKPTQRMSHIAGARALIRECNWNARSLGLGAACFWLNVGMELLSCLAFNWQTSWEPDQWGLDMDLSVETTEEGWVHRLFYLVAKIANFRANIPKFQEPSPHDEQIRQQTRFAEWQRIKNMCDNWRNACPRTMHPFASIPSAQQTGPTKSLFPNVWIIKRAATVGQLYFHTAQCLLAQMNPLCPRDSEEAKAIQLHHAHQVCGITAHTRDHGVASVAIRSIALVAEVIQKPAEQQEVIQILKKIDHDTGWKLAGIIKQLRTVWGWDKMDQSNSLMANVTLQPPQRTAGTPNSLSSGGSLSGQIKLEIPAPRARLPSVVSAGQQALTPPRQQPPASPAQISQHVNGQMHHLSQRSQQHQNQTPQLQMELPSLPRQLPSAPDLIAQQGRGMAVATSTAPVTAPRPMRVNPLSFADFSLPNHPYQNWYEPPSRTASNNAWQAQGLFR